MIRKAVFFLLLVPVIVATYFALYEWGLDIVAFEKWTGEHAVAGGLAFIGIFVLSTILPITSLPLLPLAARAYGVPLTCVLSTLGWWIGSLLTFELARWGRPYLHRFLPKQIMKRAEPLLARRPTFSTIVILRMLFPGDVVGVALGLMRDVKWGNYAIATLLGTIPNAVVASYAGGEFGQGRYAFAIAIIAVLTAALWIVRRRWEARAAARDA